MDEIDDEILDAMLYENAAKAEGRMAPIQPLDARTTLVDVSRATEVTPAVQRAIDDMFEYHPWNDEQTRNGVQVRLALAAAVSVIIERVPPSPDRSAAIRKLREARMDCNSAITHNGRF